MDNILRKSHAKENVDILRARDYYFDTAKKINFWRSLLVFSVPVLIALSYSPYIQSALGYSEDFRDIFSGAITLMVMLVGYLVGLWIDKYAEISNQLREYYDQRVLGIQDFQGRSFLCDYGDKWQKDLEKYLSMSHKQSNRDRYSYWYLESYSPRRLANIFCCQLDNIIYSVYAYKTTTIVYTILLITFIICSLIFAGILGFNGNWQSALFALFASAECVEILLEKVTKLLESRKRCQDYLNLAKKLTADQLTEQDVIAMQYAVIENRSLSVFLPKIIRNYLMEHDRNIYEQKLDVQKRKFWGDSARLPETDREIEVVSEDGQWCISLWEVHQHLKEMLTKVIATFEKEGVDYTLDGGTLIGAKRYTPGKFIPWDDDIDLAIPFSQVEKAKQAISKHLPDLFIQDPENEEFYAPHLSNFRVRECNDLCTVSEKENPFCFKHKWRGIFIDIYAYAPTISPLWLDKLFRRCLLHSLNKKLRYFKDGEGRIKDNSIREKKYLKLKKSYLRRVKWYHTLGKNEKILAFSPEYIYRYKTPGPYFNAEDIFGEREVCVFEDILCRVPTNGEVVLQSYYGTNWKETPFKTTAEMKAEREEKPEKSGDWYSWAPRGITCLKHIANVTSVGPEYEKILCCPPETHYSE